MPTNNNASAASASSPSSPSSPSSRILPRKRTVEEKRAAEERREIEEILLDKKEREEERQKGAALLRELQKDSIKKGARPGAGNRYQGLGGIDTSLIVRRLV